MTHTRTAKEFPDPSHPASTDAAEAFTTGGRMEGRPTARDGIYVSSAESQLSDLFPSEATQGDGFDGVADDRGMDLFLSEADTHKGSDTWATRVFVDAHA
ncbi:MAG: hypothetical protein H0T71_09960, partial [Acidobacteria bacterium]|nr:hypothetical protein [Acidobacteriota bacterium]